MVHYYQIPSIDLHRKAQGVIGKHLEKIIDRIDL